MLISFSDLLEQWEIRFDDNTKLEGLCNIEGVNPHKGNIIMEIPKTSEKIVTTYYYLGIYYPKSRYPDEYNNDRFTQIVKQFKPFSGVLPKETNKAIQKIAECVKDFLSTRKLKLML